VIAVALAVVAVGPASTATAIPLPTVLFVAPTSGSTAGGTAVTLTGSGFLEGAMVTMGGTASEVVVHSETEITATTPAGSPGSVEVVVSEESVSSTFGPKYTYVTPPPTVTKIEPSSGSTAGGTSVKMTGTNLTGASSVTFGAAEATGVKVESPSEIVATSPAGSGSVNVTVTTTGGTSATSAADEYTYVTPPPTVTKIEPSSGSTAGGTPVTITGSGFVSPATVTIGGNAASEVFVASETEITAKTPAGSAGPVGVVINDVNGPSSGGPSYGYIAPPPCSAAPSIEEQPKAQTVTEPSTAMFTAAGSTPENCAAPTVQWYSEVSGAGSFSAIGGATLPSYTTPATTTAQSGTKFEAVFKNAFGETTSNEVTLTVEPPPCSASPSIEEQPASQPVTEPSTATFTVTEGTVPANCSAATIQWQVSTNKGLSWGSVSGANISGGTSATLSIKPTSTTETGNEYRAVLTNAHGETTSTEVTLEVRSAPVVKADPASKGVLAGEATTFTATATGTPTPSVQWQVSTDFGEHWTDDTSDVGNTTTTLTIAFATLAQNGYEYRAVFSNSAGGATSASATLTVSEKKVAPTITEPPTEATVSVGNKAVFTASASGVPTPSVQWQESRPGGATWSNISGATSGTLTVVPTTLSYDGRKYRAVFTNSAGGATSASAMLTVVEPAPLITKDPISTTVLVGLSATFTAAASSISTPTVLWEISKDSGVTWSKDTSDPGSSTTTLTVPSTTAAENGYEYRAVFKNTAGEATSTPATLTVDTVPAVTIDPISTAVKTGETATFTAVAAGTPTPEVQWQESTDGGSTWITVPGATTDTLTLPGVPLSDSGREYRAVFTNSAGHVESTPAMLTVTAPTVATPSTQLPPPTAPPPAGQPLTTTFAPSSPPAPRTMLPFPVVRIAGSENASGVKISLLTVQAPGGAEIAILCRGRGCPKTESRVMASGRRAGTTLVEFRRFERSLRAGAVLEIRISKGGEIGKYTRFTIRRGKPPARVDTCLSPTGITPMVCPSS
jgi:IPT/TIG domain/Immunoglobulin I-set domain/Immunoglobulin domain